MSEDVFKVADIVQLQAKLLSSIEDEPDVAIKIAALRAAADLLQQALSIAMLTAQFKTLLGPRG